MHIYDNHHLQTTYCGGHQTVADGYSLNNLSKKFRNRLYALLSLLVVMIGIKGNRNFNPGSYYFYYTLLGVATIVFVYSCCPLAQKALAELRKRAVGAASLMTFTIIILYIYSVAVFINTRELGSLIEFFTFMVIIVLGGCAMQISGDRTNTIVNSQKKQIDDILASINEVLWSIDADTHKLLYLNAACYNVVGYKPEELLSGNVPFLNSIHPDDRPIFYDAMQTAIAKGNSFFEFRVIHKDGTVKYLGGEGRFQKGIDGEVGVINGIAKDITLQRMAELDANEKAQEVENILGSINDAFFAIDTNYNITYVNSEFRELYKNYFKILVGVSYTDVAPMDVQKRFYKYCNKALSGQTNVGFEEYCILLNKWLYYKICPTATGAAIYITDITEHKELLQQVLAEKAKLEVQNEKLAQIAWLQSHKVRAPVVNILGLIQLLDYQHPLCADNADILKGVKEAAENLDEVIRKISDTTNSMETTAVYQKQYQSMAYDVRHE